MNGYKGEGDSVTFEPAFIDKSIIIFKIHGTGSLISQPDPYYFHLINSKNPIKYYDYKSDIETYVSKIIENEESRIINWISENLIVDEI